MLSAIIIGDDTDLIRYLRQVCGEFSDICIYKILSATARRYEVLATLNAYSPDVVFLDMSDWQEVTGSQAGCLEELLLRQGQTAIVPITKRARELPGGRDGDPTLAIGPTLAVPFDAEELDRTVHEALRRTRTTTSVSQVVAFLPAKPGSGATTLALHTARAAASRYNQRTLLIEADQQSGSIAYRLHLEPSTFLADAIDNRALGDQEWKHLVSHSHGFDILPASAAPHAVKGSRWDFYRLLKFARQQYELIVVDMPAQIDDVAESILSEAEDAILVATSDTASLCMVRRRLWELESRGAKHRHLRLLVNRYAHGDWDSREMAAIATREVGALLPEDSKAMRAAIRAQGLAATQSAFDRQIVAYCGKLLRNPPTMAPARPAGLLDRCMEVFGWGIANAEFSSSAQPRLEGNGNVYRSSSRR